MIWALLAILGVPIWLVVGLLAGALISRRRFARLPGVFVCRVRDAGGRNWPRSTRHARWVHDVLLVNGGPARLQARALGITDVLDGPDLSDARFRRADASVAVTVRTDDGLEVEVAAPAGASDLLLGPFVQTR